SNEDYPDVHLSQIKNRKTMSWHDSLNPQSCIEVPSKDRHHIISEKTIVDGIFPGIARSAKAIGHLNMDPNDDGVIRQVPLLYSFGKNRPVYLPMSVRTVATLFGTPNEEIIFKPKQYLDIGKPFKIFKNEDNSIRFSYPNLSVLQIKAILERSKEILALKPNEKLTITSLLKIGRDINGAEFISSYSGDLPQPVVYAFLKNSTKNIKDMKPGTTISLTQEIEVTRDSDVEWILSAPYGDEEWYLTEDDLKMISMLSLSDFESIGVGQTILAFHNFSVKNKNGKLLSDIPVLRDKTLKELCRLKWTEIEEMKPGMRRDIGKNVRIPLTHDNEHIITYFGKRKKPFRYYPYYDIMNDRIQGSLDGKIYLVGSTVAAMFDIVCVPIEKVYPGVEVHASLINSFMTNTFVTRLAKWQDFMILLLVGIITGILSYILKPLTSAVLTVFFIFGYFLIAMTIFGGDLIWIEIARPILTILLTYTAVMAFRYITEEKDRKFLQNTFKQYLSPELIEIMYKEKQVPKLGGEEGIRTAYFSDIQSFSSFSEKLGSPTRLVDLLNEYLTAMTDSLLSHYGTLDKYEGDAIVAFFGAPMPMDDHAQQACATALDMQNKLSVLREKWTGEGEKWPEVVHKMRMRIGINTGPITTGNMGSAVRMNYTMMGDAVNLAARLESAAKQYGVYTMISHITYEIIRDDFETRQLDKITVVGKSEPVIIYELLGKKGDLDSEMKKMLNIYQQGVDSFYGQQWDVAIEALEESEKLEPCKEFSVGNMSPSKKLIEYCNHFKSNPPGDDWDGVIKLTSK
ncbi:MAG: adenylate/guanylate cyclase domain-containing protein, partial [Chitinispirillia bacterium]